jgi:phosphoribosylamine---glycine ligase
MKILIVGNGGREHAFLDSLRRDDPRAELFVTRGNGGTAGLATPVPLDPTDAPALAAWAAAHAIDLAIVGPEAALAEGIADLFERRAIPLFGPTLEAAAIETSKAWSKSLMEKAGVPTAGFRTFTALEPALTWIRTQGAPIVVKASGLAAGKGAVVCSTEAEALDAARAMLHDRAFGGAGAEIVVEEFMTGEELSIFAVCDGRDALLMLPAQDHKRIGEGDTGPNTGGMGAYAPVSIAGDDLADRVLDSVVLPTLDIMRHEKRPFRGLLFCGLILTDSGPKVVEFNARFGDPETQVVLPLLETPLVEVLLPIARGDSIRNTELRWRRAAALTTVLAAAGYPGTPEKGARIDIPATLGHDDDVRVFHAGTRRDDDGTLRTDGGRVLAVTAIAPDLRRAAERSRLAAESITFEGRQFRRDIGWRELERIGHDRVTR